MIPKPIVKLVIEIAGKIGAEDRREARKDPEKCLLALLLGINRDITRAPNTSMLDISVRNSFFGDIMGQASQVIARERRRKTNSQHKKNRAHQIAR